MIAKTPTLVTYDITYECNLACDICQTKNYTGSSYDKGFMKKEDIVSSAQKIFDESGAQLYRFMGAEPLLHPEIVEIVREVSQVGSTWITTNGTLLTIELATELCEAGLSYIIISLDGPKSNSSTVRGVEAYEKALKGVKIIDSVKKETQSNINIVVNNTITKHNYNKLLQVAQILKPYDVSIGANAVHSMRNALKGASFERTTLDYLGETPEQHDHLSWFQKRIFHFQYHLILSRQRKLFVRPFYVVAAQLRRYFLEAKRKMIFTPCARPSQHLNIRNDGEIYPCEFLRPHSLGSIHDETIWNSEKRKEIAQKLACGDLAVCQECNKERIYN